LKRFPVNSFYLSLGCAIAYFLFSERVEIFKFNFVFAGKVEALLQALAFALVWEACKCAQLWA